MADEPKDAENSDEAGKGKGKKKIMLFAMIGVAVLVLAGGGFFAYTKFLAPKPAIEGKESLAEEEKKKKPEAETAILELEPFVVNLSDPKGKRYLKVKISLEVESAEKAEKAKKSIPKMRDMVIMMLTSLTFEEVMTPEGKIRVRDELLERFNLVMRPDRIQNIYFTEFVIQ